MKLFYLPAICALLFLSTAAHAFNPCTDSAHYTPLKQRYTKGLLFKIEKCKSPVSYVFGTVHLARPQIADASANAFAVLKNVQAAGFELANPEVDVAAAFSKFTILAAGHGHSLSSLLGKDYFGRLVAELRFMALLKGRIINADMLDRLQPWVASILLEVIDDEKGFVLDEKLWIAANLQDKPIFGLESAQEQAEVFSTLSGDLQVRMLKETIDHYPNMLREKETLIAAYLDKDANKIQSLEENSMSAGDDKELNEEMRDRLLVKRNKIMVQRLLPRLETQSVLVAIGVLHLPGDDGVLHLLEQKGYFITPMP